MAQSVTQLVARTERNVEELEALVLTLQETVATCAPIAEAQRLLEATDVCRFQIRHRMLHIYARLHTPA